MFGFSVEQLLLIFFITLLGAILQSAIGFGLGPFAVPLLVLIDTRFVPGPLLFAAVTLTTLMYLRDRSEVRLQEFTWASAGRVLGSLLGAYFLTIFPAQHLKPLFAALVIFAVLLSVSGLHLSLTPKNLLGAGIVSGFMGTVAAIGGAPMALVYQHQKGSKLRGTLAAIFILGTIIALISLSAVGKFGLQDIYRGLLLIPGVITGFLLSKKVVRFLDRGYLRPAILIVTTLAALVLVIDALR
ncbi:sulfite exporter TauE/SafE family protein [candidate division KSB1 bacterium]|nr:MAG: sulfite exporter TauE/SafE family protein [candidate division KSB1 bacterium]